jgi:hypothetical protein
MTFTPTKYDKSRTRLENFVTIYCDHCGSCKANRPCPALDISRRPADLKKEDIAFAEPRHCSHYRHRDSDGLIKGADIQELGIWK